MEYDLIRLREKIQEYLEQDDDRDFLIGEDTAEDMAKAAMAVLMGIRNSQIDLIREGSLVEK